MTIDLTSGGGVLNGQSAVRMSHRVKKQDILYEGKSDSHFASLPLRNACGCYAREQIEHQEICEEYAMQMKELEEILAQGPAAMNVSLEQLAKQVRGKSTQIYSK